MIIVVTLVAIAALIAGLAGWGLGLGIATMVLMTSLAVFGLGRSASTATKLAVALFGIVFCGLIYLCFALDKPDEPLRLIGGFPAGTAVLVYAIGPLGLALGLIYGFSFDREILPAERLEKFIDRFGQSR